MNIKNVVIYSALRLINHLFCFINKPRLYKSVAQNTAEKNIYFFLKPITPNTGDMAQDMCIERWFKSLYPEYNVISIPHRFSSNKLLKLLQTKIKHSDLIFICSGFTINDPNADLYYMLGIIPLFHQNKIIILPQTIDLISNDVKDKVIETFDAHPNLTLLCRDRISFERSKKMFSHCHIKIFPDFVTSLIGNYNIRSEKRSGVLLVLRNDLEKCYDNSEIKNLKDKLIEFGICQVDTTDTLLVRSSFYTVSCRDSIIERILYKFSLYQLIITDRYHGLIFSQIVSVPVIVLRSTNHKLTSGIEWFPQEIFGHNLYYADCIGEAYQIAIKRILDKTIYLNPPYFFEKYFNNKELI